MRWHHAISVVSAALLLAACGTAAGEESGAGGSSRFAGVELDEPTDKPDFTLTDTDGLPYDFRAETEGRVTILYFGYTYCPDICPVHLAQVAEVLERPGMPRDAEVVFVSVDPDRDSPERIREWLDAFSDDFVGLTGDPGTVVAAQEAAGVVPAIIEDDDDADGSYLVGHAGQVLVYAPDGRGYTVYPFGTRQSQWAHDLPLLADIPVAGDGA